MNTFIFDIGKTNIKGVVLDEYGRPLWTGSTPNMTWNSGDYPSIDVEEIWRWLQATLACAAQLHVIHAINVSTHGACAVLLSQGGEPLFPVMDYEVERLENDRQTYAAVRPAYEHTLSPDLSGGLNLGRQIWWLKQHYPQRFERLHRILLYPQYWVWKLTGHAVSEVTSLGCHTDLWQPLENCFSALVAALDVERAMPPVVESNTCVGHVTASLAQALGLPDNCAVYAGVHDSNASLARYLAADLETPFTVVSTGTWVVAMAVGSGCDGLREERDMLANVNVRREPVACARFMGGREFEIICELTGASQEDVVNEAEVDALIAGDVLAVPPFETGSGPFRGAGRPGRLTGQTGAGASLATLYLALMIDYELDLLSASGPVLLGSTSLKNPLLCRLLSQLRPAQAVLMSNDTASTIRGAWCLTRWNRKMAAEFSRFEVASATQFSGLEDYRQRWRAAAEAT